METKDMTERIDHAAEALKVARPLESDAYTSREVWLAEAQLHATLALVDAQKDANEQARIANLIALANVTLVDPGAEVTPMERTAWEALGVKYTGEIRPEIAAALGIETKGTNDGEE